MIVGCDLKVQVRLYAKDAGLFPAEVIQVKDNVKKIKGMHSRDDRMHALIRACGILYSEHESLPFGRWLVGSETASMQGFRVNPKFFTGPEAMAPVCSLDIDRPDRKSQHTRESMGNAMCVPVVAALLLHQWRTAGPKSRDHATGGPGAAAGTTANSFLSLIMGNGGIGAK